MYVVVEEDKEAGSRDGGRQVDALGTECRVSSADACSVPPSRMAPKRKRQTTLQSNGLKSGEPLQRQNLAGREFASWSWVGNEVTSVSGITNAHQLAAYGFGSLGTRSTCPNKYTQPTEALVKPLDNDEPDTEVITVVSDDDVPISCDKRRCRANPYCLSYLGQDKWEKTG